MELWTLLKNTREKELEPKIRKQKKKTLPEKECAPPMDALKEIERGGIGLVSWERYPHIYLEGPRRLDFSGALKLPVRVVHPLVSD